MKRWKDKQEFKSRVYYFAKEMDIAVKSLTLRPMRSKWASCSTSGNLNFNEELLALDKKIGDYVIVHELLHFRVPNHGKLWKSLMRVYLRDYEKIENKLKILGRKEQRLFEGNCNLQNPFLRGDTMWWNTKDKIAELREGQSKI